MWPLPFDESAFSDRRARPACSPDISLTCRVIERILDEPRLDGERIIVHVQNRVVSLIGTVSCLHARVMAAELARSTPGVADICNRLELARAADVTDDVADLRSDPFDVLIAHWDEAEEYPQSARQTWPTTVVLFLSPIAVVLITALMPRLRSAPILVVLFCLAAAMTLTLYVGRRHATRDGGRRSPL